MNQLAVGYDSGFWEQPENRIEVDNFLFGIPNVIANTDKLSDKAQAILGENGCKRFSEFLQYQEYWDQTSGKALSLRSVGILNYFFSKYNKFASEPSLFLTRDGNLQLGWEDRFGKKIEIEFGSDKITFYIESSDLEDCVDLSISGSLTSQLESIN